MRAAFFSEYGPPDVLQVKEVEQPIPKENEILVKIYATSINFGDILVRRMNEVTPCKFTMPLPLWLPTRLIFGYRKPKIQILGNEFAGKVEMVGRRVRRFKKGDQVFGYRGPAMGANAEYITTRENGLVAIRPANLTFEEAAAIPYGAITALSLLRKVNIHPGQKVLINGASGGIGSAAVQLAKYFGAEVTGVCATPRLTLVKALGADQVIDYREEDFTQNGENYDLIVDVLGKSSFKHCKSSLKPNGIYLLASFKTKQLFEMIQTKLVGTQKVICALSGDQLEDLVFVKDLVEAGKYKMIIDRCYPLEQIVEAHRYVESGLKKGVVVIKVAYD